jgi:hypothetical protein
MRISTMICAGLMASSLAIGPFRVLHGQAPPLVIACIGEEIRFCNEGVFPPNCSMDGVCGDNLRCSLPFELNVVLPMFLNAIRVETGRMDSTGFVTHCLELRNCGGCTLNRIGRSCAGVGVSVPGPDIGVTWSDPDSGICGPGWINQGQSP